MPFPSPKPTHRGGLWAGLRAGARGLWLGYTTVVGDQPPQAVRKLKRWEEWVAVAPMLFWFIPFIISTRFTMFRGLPWLYFLLAALVTTFILQIVFWRKLRRLRAHVASLDYRICPVCDYSLVELAESGVCPECGTAYSPDALEEVWKRR